jgi:hypothetical protein
MDPILNNLFFYRDGGGDISQFPKLVLPPLFILHVLIVLSIRRDMADTWSALWLPLTLALVLLGKSWGLVMGTLGPIQAQECYLPSLEAQTQTWLVESLMYNIIYRSSLNNCNGHIKPRSRLMASPFTLATAWIPFCRSMKRRRCERQTTGAPVLMVTGPCYATTLALWMKMQFSLSTAIGMWITR